ncbi:LuxR family transcriptional activator of bioluminescence operon/LuxR family quorum sensing-dependent transcriptional regulator [Roseateles depolymerans]|uniref:Transcriptional activator protein LasR n=1 Tax=Roseateles depolymerans TaxID=76731 RepID=A0A0U3KZW5_9BURK|nr:Transcriptional activator protein LasR [Roseateles depolymerans]REG14155.1 LuxR family transcriptional activator of bioluminescence operon/LuxR family quorum sensing-dependent transcriptional regulator [Roseateles depolymerans]
MLQGGYQSVLEARSRDEFRSELTRFANDLDFERFSAILVVDRAMGSSEFITVGNTPAGFTSMFNDPRLGKKDPVMQHCKRQSVPIVWNQQTYQKHDAPELWEAQAAFGYKVGISLALHLPEGRHFVLGVNREETLPNNPVTLTRMVADLQLFAVHAVDAALRVLLPHPHAPGDVDAPRLTPRELQCLHWTMEGKTAWEVGTILSITERTAVLHINNAMHKLGCTNKHQAVLKALRLGLIR